MMYEIVGRRSVYCGSAKYIKTSKHQNIIINKTKVTNLSFFRNFAIKDGEDTPSRQKKE